MSDSQQTYTKRELEGYSKGYLIALILGSAPVPADPQRIAETPERRVERLVAELTKAHADLDEARAELEKLKSAPVPAPRSNAEVAWDELIDGPKSAPVPAPRLEWTKTDSYYEAKRLSDSQGHWVICDFVNVEGFGLAYLNALPAENEDWPELKYCPTLAAAKSLAEKLNDVLSPPVGTQE